MKRNDLMALAGMALLVLAGLSGPPAQAGPPTRGFYDAFTEAPEAIGHDEFVSARPIVPRAMNLAWAGAVQQAEWELTMLPLDPAWDGAFANDINDTGLVAGAGVDDAAPFVWYPAYWEDGQPYALLEACGAPEGWEGSNGVVMRVNNAWQATVDLWGPMGQNSWRWDIQTCEVENLHPAGWWASGSTDINERGDVTGYLIGPRPAPIPPGMPPWRGLGYHWSHNGRRDRLLDPGEFSESWGNGVNNRGTVAGISFDRDALYHATVWTGEARIDLHPDLVAADPRTLHTIAWDVHENGTVVGHSVTEFAEPCNTYFNGCFLETRAWAWNEATGVVFLDSGGYLHAKPGEAADEYIVGTLGDCPNEGDWQAGVWVQGQLEIIPDPPGLPISEPWSVNRKGMVAGYSLPECGSLTYYPWVAQRTTP
jgi:uncharacterized membrane protein